MQAGVYAEGMPFRMPDRETLIIYLKELSGKSALFATVYFFCNWAASQRTQHWHLYVPWELDIPFVPEFIWVYISVYACCFLPLFLMTGPQIQDYGRTFLKIILSAGVIFLIFPAKLGFPREAYVEGFDALFQGLYRLDRPYNLVPSLHVGMASVTVLSINASIAHQGLKWILNFWLVLVMFSVVLIHQHHLLDVVTGFALACGCVWHTNKNALRAALFPLTS